MISRGIILALLALSITTSALAQDILSPLVPDAVIKAAGLNKVWQNTVSIRPGEHLNWMALYGQNLYATTSSNYLFALSAKTGKLAFSEQIASPGFPIFNPVIYDNNQLLIVSGSDVLFIETEFGTVKKVKLAFRPAASVDRNSKNLYVPAIDSRLHVYDINEKIHLFAATADDDSLINSVIAQPERVLFGTVTGQVVSMHADSPTRWWQYAVNEKVTAPLVQDGNSVYVASWDTNLYRIKLTDGKLVWKCQLAGLLKNPPVVTDKIVYEYVQDRGVSAIDKESGKELWNIADAIGFLSQDGARSYLLTNSGTALIIDNATGKQVERINYSDAGLAAPNSTDSKMFVANRLGKIECIAPAK